MPFFIFSSLIQSDFRGGDGHGNFEAVIQIGRDLWHYWRDSQSLEWKRAHRIRAGDVASAGAIIQSSLGDDDHGNFEVLVPLLIGERHWQLRHFVHFNDDPGSQWELSPEPVTGPGDFVMAPASLIQSSFGSEGNLEAVVPLLGPHGHGELWHFWHDSGDPASPWIKGKRVTSEWDRVIGPGSLIQSDYGGNFEVVVPLQSETGPELWHYFHDNGDPANEWVRAQRITGSLSGPGIILQSMFGDGEHNNFEVVVPLEISMGSSEGPFPISHSYSELTHFFHDTDPASPWVRGQMISASTRGWASFMRSDYGPEEIGNFEVLVEECSQSIVPYFHHNDDAASPWLRSKPIHDDLLLPEPVIAELRSGREGTRKIVQLTGEWEREGWRPRPSAPHPPFTPNQTESRYGIRSTDLGVSFLHRDRIYFLFGDTWRNPCLSHEVNLDSIAFTTDQNPELGLRLTFYREPPLLHGISQAEFEVPLDGISLGSRMSVFFSTDHRHISGQDVMGRSILAVSDDEGRNFTLRWELSRIKFINVSVQVAEGRDIGLPDLWLDLADLGQWPISFERRLSGCDAPRPDRQWRPSCLLHRVLGNASPVEGGK